MGLEEQKTSVWDDQKMEENLESGATDRSTFKANRLKQ